MDAGGLLHLFIYVLVIGCVFGLGLYLLSILPIPDPWKGWIRIFFIAVVVIFLMFWLLSLVGGGPNLHIR